MTNDAPMSEVKAQCQRWLQAANGAPAVMFAEVRAVQDSRTHQITVKGMLGVAPDRETIILYPIGVYRFLDPCSKAMIKKTMAEVKKELLARMEEEGYSPRNLKYTDYSGEENVEVRGKVKMEEIRF